MTIKSIIAKPFFIALILFFSSLFIRTLWLDKIPPGIVNDNMIFVLNAKAVFYTGTDVTGLWNPLKFSPIPDEPAQAELPYTYLAPIIGILPSSLFSAHIFHALINSFFVVVLFFIVLRLLSIGPAILVGLVACFNPWSIFFSRSAFEATLALSFYVFGFFILIKTTSWKKLLSVIPLAIGFYTYMAYKLTFLPYVFAISFFTWHEINKKKYTKQFIVVLLFCLFIFFSFIVNVKSQSTAGRLNELAFFSASEVEKEVNAQRRDSIKNPFTNIFSNKATIAAKKIISKYYGAFSPDYLFINNEWTLRFHLYNHGYFYYADFLFFILGFCFLFSYKRRLWLLLTIIILLAPIPSVVSNVETSYAMRSSLYFPFFYIFIGCGIWYLLTLFKSKKYLIFASFIIGGLYAVLIANFLYTYFFIQPIYGAEGAAFSQRVVSKYVSLANKENKALTVINKSPKELYKNFIFFSDNYNRKTTNQVKASFLNHSYLFNNVSFVKCQSLKTIEKDRIYIFDPGEKCLLFNNLKNMHSIVQLSDSGTVYDIYQDTICSPFSLKSYIKNLTLDDLSIENLSSKTFCETFIIDYKNK